MIKIKRILLPTDFSDCSKQALKYALDFALERKARLYILHVIQELSIPVGTEEAAYPIAQIYDDMEREANKNIHRLVPKRFREKLRVEHIILRGTPYLEIIKIAKKYNVDLITIATHGRTGISHMLLGSTAEKVVRKAPCPVLSVKHPKHEFVMP